MALAKLPTLTFNSLDAILGAKKSATIGHVTTARRSGNIHIVIEHHGTPIAYVSQGAKSVAVTVAGWDSMSTIGRVNSVLVDNGRHTWEKGNRWHCSRRNWNAVFINTFDEKNPVDAHSSEWWLLTIDGDLIPYNPPAHVSL